MIKEIQMAKQEEKQAQVDDTLNLEGDFEMEEKGLEAPENIDESSESEAIISLSKEEAHGPKWDNEQVQMRNNDEEEKLED